MKLSGESNIALKALYDAPNHTGDIVELLTAKGVSEPLERARRAGKELEKYGLLEYLYDQTRLHVDAKLSETGIKLMGGKR